MPAKPSSVSVILVVFAALTISLAVLLNIWQDEAYSLRTSGGSVAQAWSGAIEFELQPPVYFVLLCLWRGLSASIVWARLLSVLCATVTVALVPALARRYVPRAPAPLLTALVAFNPFTIYAAIDIRLYAFALLLSALLLLFFHDGYLADTATLAPRLLHGLVGLLALYTQYYLGPLLLCGAVALAVTRRFRSLWIYVASMAVVGAFFLPMIPVVLRQVTVHAGTVTTRPSLKYAARLLAWRVQNWALPTELVLPEVAQWAAFAAFTLVVLALAFRAWRARPWTTPGTAMVTLAASLAAIFFVILLNTGEELLAPKHTVAFFLPALLSLAIVAATGAGPRAVSVWLGLAALVYSAALIDRYKPLAKLGDYERVAHALMELEKPDQPILVFSAQNELPLSLYYKGRNRIVAVPHTMNFRTFDVPDMALHSEAEIWTALGQEPVPGSEVWLFTHGPVRYLDVDLGNTILDSAVERRFDVVKDLPFFKARLRLLRAR